MPSPRHLVTAVAIGLLGGSMCALWVTIAEAQGQTFGWPPAARAPDVGRCAAAPALAVADSSAPARTEASKPVVDGRARGCP